MDRAGATVAEGAGGGVGAGVGTWGKRLNGLGGPGGLRLTASTWPCRRVSGGDSLS